MCTHLCIYWRYCFLLDLRQFYLIMSNSGQEAILDVLFIKFHLDRKFLVSTQDLGSREGRNCIIARFFQVCLHNVLSPRCFSTPGSKSQEDDNYGSHSWEIISEITSQGITSIILKNGLQTVWPPFGTPTLDIDPTLSWRFYRATRSGPQIKLVGIAKVNRI